MIFCFKLLIELKRKQFCHKLGCNEIRLFETYINKFEIQDFEMMSNNNVPDEHDEDISVSDSDVVQEEFCPG